MPLLRIRIHISSNQRLKGGIAAFIFMNYFIFTGKIVIQEDKMAGMDIDEIRRLSREYVYLSVQMHENIARQAGLAGTDYKYLELFLQKQRLTAGELADLTGLTTGAVTGLIDRFEEKKLVKRQLDKTDRRKVFIVPDSRKIQSLLKPFYKDFLQASEKLIGSFSNKEIKAIETYFVKTIACMNETNDKLMR